MAGDSVWLSVTGRPSDPWVSAIGLAYDMDVGLRGWVGVLRRDAVVNDGAVSLRLAAGRWRQEAEAAMQWTPVRSLGVTPVLSVAGAHEDVRVFTETGIELPAVGTGDLTGLVGVERDLGAGWTARLGATYSWWADTSAVVSSAPGIAARVTRRTGASGAAARADVVWNAEYSRAALEAAWPVAVGRLRVTPGVRYGWGRRLPPQYRFPLGGADGFPGLQFGEVRGEHEALVRLTASVPVMGPLSVIAEAASGIADMGGDVFPAGEWRLGARIGLAVDVPFVPLQIAYGRSTGSRSALLLRVGRWF
jgi:hypothetical protein